MNKEADASKEQAPGINPDVLPRVVVYSKPGCHLCDVAKNIIQSCRSVAAFEMKVIDISLDASLMEKYGKDIPVVLVNDREIARHFIRQDRLLTALRAEGSVKSI